MSCVACAPRPVLQTIPINCERREREQIAMTPIPSPSSFASPPPTGVTTDGDDSNDINTWGPYAGVRDFKGNALLILSAAFCAVVLFLAISSIVRFLLCSSWQHGRDGGSGSDGGGEPGHEEKSSNPGSSKDHVAIDVTSFSKGMGLAGSGAECAICLSEFEEGEGIRVLPACRHGFHVRCVERWLAVRRSCPTCRSTASSSSSSSLLEEGRMVHGLVFKTGFISDSYVENTLLHMYASCRVIGCARQVFDEMGDRNVVSWSSMIEGYVSCDHPREALMVFRQMRLGHVQPNSVTLISLLSACSNLGSLNIGRSIHSYIVINSLKLDVALGTALIGMYNKCGRLEKGLRIFTSMEEKNLQSWTIMISGLADHGCGKEAIALFYQLEESGLKPDSVLFSPILSACSHAGLVEEGLNVFRRMVNVYKVKPTMEHYGCMVDMLGRAGLVEAAYGFIKEMPVAPNSVILRSILGSCRKNGFSCDVESKLIELLIKVEPGLGANYVLSANLVASSGKWSDVVELRSGIVARGLKKVPGCSWVEVGGQSGERVSKECKVAGVGR
nr:pentatricopeptide repeat protein AaPPR775 [Agave angustifolia]